jgi:hypothetical protein
VASDDRFDVLECTGLDARCGRTVEAFRFDRWRDGALLGAKPERAFFVRCDRTTIRRTTSTTGGPICSSAVGLAREGACGPGSAFSFQ